MLFWKLLQWSDRSQNIKQKAICNCFMDFVLCFFFFVCRIVIETGIKNAIDINIHRVVIVPSLRCEQFLIFKLHIVFAKCKKSKTIEKSLLKFYVQAKMSTSFIPMDSLMDASSSSQDSIKSSGSNNQANKNRKGSLSAVIDKLKSARHVNDESPPNTPTISAPPQSISADTNTITATIPSGQAISKEKTASANTPTLNLTNGN